MSFEFSFIKACYLAMLFLIRIGYYQYDNFDNECTVPSGLHPIADVGNEVRQCRFRGNLQRKKGVEGSQDRRVGRRCHHPV